ncbi:uncharacterized protein LOC111826525 [Myotis lucifugus]|uniref:uncharacterized protein LOC111826525 n=1 Tax=Myotis lucifugus TaxID=59463 RepID=UPI000CCC5174|nr:uncharacterized protein LOC111826525 [Myotis lucifugus]
MITALIKNGVTDKNPMGLSKQVAFAHLLSWTRSCCSCQAGLFPVKCPHLHRRRPQTPSLIGTTVKGSRSVGPTCSCFPGHHVNCRERHSHSSSMGQPPRGTRTTMKPAQHQLSPPAEALGTSGQPGARRVKEQIWSYLLLTARFTQEPCAAPTHIAFGLQRSEMHVGERGVRPGQQTSEGCRGRRQKCPLDARPGSVSWVSLGALVAQLLWGSQGSRSRWVLHEGSESRLHAVHPGAITRAWSPATSQPGLHLGLTRRTLETDKTEEDALTRLLPAERSSPLQR